MKILIGCEHSGVMRRAFRALGHDAYSNDILPSSDDSEFHIQGDVFDAIARGGWDFGLFHPDCTYLCSSGLHWNKRVPGREEKTEAATAFAVRLWNCEIEKVVIENSIGRLGTVLPTSARQIVQPNQFGDDASKGTCFWRRGGIPALIPTVTFPPRLVEWPKGSGKICKRWGNQTDSGQNKLPPSADRWKRRAETYPGIANACALQWGGDIRKGAIENEVH